MSHITKVAVQVRDLAAVESACRDLGLTFMRGQKTQAYYGGTSACLHAIKVPGSSYEIGLIQAKDGKGYELAFDSWGTGQVISEKLGAGLEKLKQGYAVALASMRAKAQGWIVSKSILPNGTVRLQMSGV